MSSIRLAMWSGPRNISTTMMRSFENRPDCSVIDEPFYSHYLDETGLNHPMRAEILESQPANLDIIIADITVAPESPLTFFKMMAQHITDQVKTDWLDQMQHFFLIRDPVRMLASYAEKAPDHMSVYTALKREVEIFELVQARTGKTPPVIDAQDILTNPQAVLTELCDTLGIPFYSEMLEWPAGPRESDGVWARHWYKSVETSTGFRPPVANSITLTPKLQEIADACFPYYIKLYERRLSVVW
ncbi:MAG: hypothetical protein MRY72_13790 [Aquisalinus sp.]|nr:hypothetical protein [Aquisalinus sp.]